MHRATPGLRTEPDARLADLDRRRPEYRTWLGLLGEARQARDDPAWAAPLSSAELDRGDAARSPDEPRLHGSELMVDPEVLRRLLQRLMEITANGCLADASALRDYRPSPDTAMHLLLAALHHDVDGIGVLAALDGVDAGALKTVAGLAVFPLLHSAGRLLQGSKPHAWSHGYCPTCGAWPLLAELRSLDRTRRLRCGRCAEDWRLNLLCCPYCGEKDHDRLGSLVPEGLETQSVETCFTCKGYIKTVTTLQALSPFDLLLRDLETLELDVVALERGYVRPAGAGFPVEMRLRAPEDLRQVGHDG